MYSILYNTEFFIRNAWKAFLDYFYAELWNKIIFYLHNMDLDLSDKWLKLSYNAYNLRY